MPARITMAAVAVQTSTWMRWRVSRLNAHPAHRVNRVGALIATEADLEQFD